MPGLTGLRFEIVALVSATVLAFAATDASAQAPPGRDDERVLADIQQRLAKAWVGRDRATIEQFISPDWVGTGPDGSVISRSDMITGAWEAGAPTLQSIVIEEIRVRLFGGTAVVTGRTTIRARVRDRDALLVQRFTDVFVKSDQLWQAVASHVSRLTAAAK